MEIRKIIKKIILENFNSNVKIEKIQKEDIRECLDICDIVFSTYDLEPSGYLNHFADWNISVKATIDGKIVGCYILNEEPITSDKKCELEDLKPYKKRKGIQGLSLAVLPEYKNLGIGKKLRDYPLSLNYDYIWGLHLKRLENSEKWIAFGRRIVSDCGNMIITLMDLPK